MNFRKQYQLQLYCIKAAVLYRIVFTRHPLNEHEEVASLLCSTEDSDDVRMTYPTEDVHLLLNGIYDLILLQQRISTERNLRQNTTDQ